MTTTLDKATSDKVSFITFIITMFARSYKMKTKDAYLYLKKYGGLDYLFKHWWTLHTEDPYWAEKALYKTCYNNGGMR
ncbi:MAG: DUF3791 domain-containing protein [Prevotellaceae bacterium]|jgi:hypothetical protein|nr:DUF3791 domain-containing protein [Prevotellaceae bacterium]